MVHNNVYPSIAPTLELAPKLWCYSGYTRVIGNPIILVDPSGKAPEGWSEDNADLANRFGLFGNGGETYKSNFGDYQKVESFTEALANRILHTAVDDAASALELIRGLDDSYLVNKSKGKRTTFEGFPRDDIDFSSQMVTVSDVEINVEGWTFNIDKLEINKRGLSNRLNNISIIGTPQKMADTHGTAGLVSVLYGPKGEENFLMNNIRVHNSHPGRAVVGLVHWSADAAEHFNSGTLQLRRDLIHETLNDKRSFGKTSNQGC